MTSPGPSHHPATPSEWQLYVVLQRANLLAYYDTFISQGGDDIQQLLEAGDEEFLEIMALVGMASKPLHVRRLQKALQEYTCNPAPFQLLAQQRCSREFSPTSAAVVLPSTSAMAAALAPPVLFPGAFLLSPGAAGTSSGVGQLRPPSSGGSSDPGSGSMWPPGLMSSSENVGPDQFGGGGVTPVLSDAQVGQLAERAAELANTLPQYKPKMVQNKKKVSKDLVDVMEMPPDNPGRADEFRKYAAIYGRFDTKRKADKPLTLHEVCVNEAAAQICLQRPALLTRRDELFPLARQVVRNAGYQYAKGQSSRMRGFESEDGSLLPKKRPPSATGLSVSGSSTHSPSASDASAAGMDDARRRTRMEEIRQELSQLGAAQDACRIRAGRAQDAAELQTIQLEMAQLSAREMHLVTEQARLVKREEEARSSSPQTPEFVSAIRVSPSPGEESASSDREELAATEVTADYVAEAETQKGAEGGNRTSDVKRVRRSPR